MKRFVVLLVVSIGMLRAPSARAADPFVWTQWATVSPHDGWSFVAGRFHSGSSTMNDIAGYHPINGKIFIGSNTGSSFTFAEAGMLIPASGWQIIAGDFIAGGPTELAAYYVDGSVFVGKLVGSSFTFAKVGQVSPGIGWRFVSGDFDGNGAADLAGWHGLNGKIWVTKVVGGSFVFSEWGQVSPSDGWHFVAGDFTRDGHVDLAGYRGSTLDPNKPLNGSVWVGVNSGSSSFAFKQFAKLDPVDHWTLTAGRLQGKVYSDLGVYHSDTGRFFAGRNANPAFYFGSEPWKTFMPASSWSSFNVAEFTSGSPEDLFAYEKESGSLWVGQNTGVPLEGYAWPLSVIPGETIKFYISGSGREKLNTAVISRHFGGTATLVTTQTFTATTRDIPFESWENGAGWPVTFSLVIPTTWKTGVYSARLDSPNNQSAYVPFIVKPSPTSTRSKVAVITNVNTWLAYNHWGGRGKYYPHGDGEGDATRVSFMRPMPDAAPVGETLPHHHQLRAELWILGWLESSGYKPDVYTDIDFHNGVLTSGCSAPPCYDKIVLSTHPEYWTTQMFDTLKGYINNDQGSVLYLGGNGVYESGTYWASQEGMDFLGARKRVGEQRESWLLRNLPTPRPERSILGVATEECGVNDAAYQVLVPSHPVFAGMGLSVGSEVGTFGLNTEGGVLGGKAAGWETDTSSGFGAVEFSRSCNVPNDPRPVPPPPASSLPAGLVILARGNNPSHDSLPDPGAEMTFYQKTPTSFVFSVGSITFGGSLAVDPTLWQIVNNVLAMP